MREHSNSLYLQSELNSKVDRVIRLPHTPDFSRISRLLPPDYCLILAQISRKALVQKGNFIPHFLLLLTIIRT
jgi:hypothetical protein